VGGVYAILFAPLPPCETSHKKLKTQNDKKKIENSKTSKYQNKKPSKFIKRKANTSSPLL
jgi:hypothetical protein